MSIWINEFHYDNDGGDVGEFIEIAGPIGTDLTGWSIVLYNGSGGASYTTLPLSGLELTNGDDGIGTLVIDLPPNGLQNGSPDGLAVVDNTGSVVEFLSYEGSFTATDGPAAGLTSTDIGIAETGATPIGSSLQRTGTGREAADFTVWAAAAETKGATNTGQTIGEGGGGTDPAPAWINEFHYDNDGGDVGEFIEVAGIAGTDLTGWSLVLYNGNGGASYNTLALPDGPLAEVDNGLGVVVIDLPVNGLQNGGPDGIALVDDAGDVVEFLSYEGSFTAVDGPASGLTSTDIGVSEPSDTPIGQSLQRTTDSPTSGWDAPADATKGALNDGPPPPPPPPPPAPDAFAIYEIQGAQHTSPLLGVSVRTTGIVTAVDSNGFYLQDAEGDGDIATSDALFVFTGSSPAVAVGDAIQIDATVGEFTPGGSSSGNLSTTQLSNVQDLQILSSGKDLPEAVILGADGRRLPTEDIDDDAFASFDPETDAIDFWESVEGMRVTATDLVAVSGTNRFGEIFAVNDPDSFSKKDAFLAKIFGKLFDRLDAKFGERAETIPALAKLLERLELKAETGPATGLSDRGTLNISPDDFNGEKIQIDEDSGVFDFDFPEVDTGAALGDVTGVVGYSFGNFEILPTEDFTPQIDPSDLAREVTDIAGGDGVLTFASYNVLNLDPNDGDGDTDVADGRFTQIAQDVVVSLGAPDIIALQEVQDNSGSENDGTTSASETLATLVAEIEAAGGPSYAWIDNVFITDNASGGQPGGNIRTAYLYDPDAVTLVETSVQTIGGQGAGEAFEGARLPLVATFEKGGEAFTFVNVHLSSKGGSAPILGVEQNFEDRQEDVTVNGSLDERQLQATAIADFITGLGDENVITLGDFNEFEFVSPVEIIEDAGLVNLTTTLPEDERYSFNFQGNSQSLDHILVSEALADGAEFDIVHINSEFAETPGRGSDHDPLVGSIVLEDAFAFA